MRLSRAGVATSSPRPAWPRPAPPPPPAAGVWPVPVRALLPAGRRLQRAPQSRTPCAEREGRRRKGGGRGWAGGRGRGSNDQRCHVSPANSTARVSAPPPLGGCRFSVSARPHPQGKPLMPVLHPWRDGCQAAEHTAPSPAGTIRYAPAGFRMPAVLELASGSSAKATPLTGPASLLAPHPGRPRLPGMWPILPARTPLLALPPVRFHMHMFSRTSD